MDRRIIFGLGSIVALLCLVPLAGVVVAASTVSAGNSVAIGRHSVLLRYTSTTLALVTVVAIGSIVIGTATAWLVVTSDFFGRRVLEIALALPLTFPAYVLAYAYTDILDHPGIVQSSLRALFGWGPRDYWFPEIRSFGGCHGPHARPVSLRLPHGAGSIQMQIQAPFTLRLCLVHHH